jgi:hypothetical protein
VVISSVLQDRSSRGRVQQEYRAIVEGTENWVESSEMARKELDCEKKTSLVS